MTGPGAKDAGPVRMDGRNVLVTGAASGIGAAAARRLSAEGARVAVADIDADGAAAVARELGGVGIEMDVSAEKSVAQGMEVVKTELGSLHALVNNAGTDCLVPFLKTEPRVWDEILGVNLRGVMLVTRAALDLFAVAGDRSIVSISSEAARMGAELSVPYSAAKAGVIGFTRALARELAPEGVRCNAVAPGPIDTPMFDATVDQLGDKGEKLNQIFVDATMLGRLGTPEEVAAVVAFLASEDASYVTGQTWNVNGGMSLG